MLIQLKKGLFFTLFLLATITQIQAQGIEFHQGTWEEALAKAKAENKLIFMDAYASWCGPCKMMSKNVFPNKKVGEFYNQNFISVKMNMEKGEGPELARKYRVRAYPTLFFINGDGKVVHQSLGYHRKNEFLKLGKQALKKG